MILLRVNKFISCVCLVTALNSIFCVTSVQADENELVHPKLSSQIEKLCGDLEYAKAYEKCEEYVSKAENSHDSEELIYDLLLKARVEILIDYVKDSLSTTDSALRVLNGPLANKKTDIKTRSQTYKKSK